MGLIKIFKGKAALREHYGVFYMLGNNITFFSMAIGIPLALIVAILALTLPDKIVTSEALAMFAMLIVIVLYVIFIFLTVRALLYAFSEAHKITKTSVFLALFAVPVGIVLGLWLVVFVVALIFGIVLSTI